MHLNDITAHIHFMVSDPNKEIGNYSMFIPIFDKRTKFESFNESKLVKLIITWK